MSHKSKKTQIGLRELDSTLKEINSREIDLSQKTNRFVAFGDTNAAITNTANSSRGILLTLRKFRDKDLKGSFLKDGQQTFDVREVLNKSLNRDDSATVNENFVKIFNDGILIMQHNKFGMSINNLKYYLEQMNGEYNFDILPIYKSDLMEQIENGNIKEFRLNIGLMPNKASFDADSYTGAAMVELRFKKPSHKQSFINIDFVKNLLSAKKTSRLGLLDCGDITNAKVFLQNSSTPIGLGEYEMCDEENFKNQEDFDNRDKDLLFDNLYNKWHDYLQKYLEANKYARGLD